MISIALRAHILNLKINIGVIFTLNMIFCRLGLKLNIEKFLPWKFNLFSM